MATNLSAMTNTLFRPRKFFIEQGFTVKDIFELVQQHNMLKPAYDTLGKYYRGEHMILNRIFDDENKPNNKAVHNFPKLIVDNSVSYFMGKPINYLSKESKLKEEVERLSLVNNEDDENAELVKLTAIYGHAFEITWVNENGDIRYKAINPGDVLYLRSTDIEEKPLCAVHYRVIPTKLVGEDKILMTVYTDTKIEEYEGKGNQVNSELKLIKTTPHFFGEVPVVEYIANEDRMGDFETIISLVDAYNLSVSDSVNDINYLNDAYLLLRNLISTEDEDIEDMKNNRIMLTDEEGDAKWLVKQVNDRHIENIKERLVADIHKFSMTPNLADEKFASNLSGVAISYKLIGLENKTAVRERKFSTGIMHRLRLIVNILNLKGNSFDVYDIKPIFTRNIPQNINELVNTVVSLQDIVPDRELLAQLPFVEDAEQAMEDLKKQREDNMENSYMFSEPDFDIGGQSDGTETDKKDTNSPRADLRTSVGKESVRQPKKSNTK